MKSRSLKIYLISAGVLLLVYIVAQVSKPKPINWTITLNHKDKIPFGTFIMFDRLKDIFPGARIVTYTQPVYNVLAEDSVKNSSYIIVAPTIELTDVDYDQLVKYVKDGNDVFIGARFFGKLLKKNLHIETEQTFDLTKADSVHFLNPSINPDKRYGVLKGIGNVSFHKFDTLKASVESENSTHKANFLKFRMGKGSLYLMSNPSFFSNYSMLNPQGRQYAAAALSLVKNTDHIIWDEYYTGGGENEESPMNVFLSHTELAWAYYITLFSLLIFVLFEIKRRQRIIPVIEPLSNSTLEFVNVVGQVYYEKRNNANIAHKKVLYLLEHLREEYQLKTNKLDNEFIDRLTAKLNLEPEFAVTLVNHILYINAATFVSDAALIELNKLIEQFYTKSR